MKGRVLLCSSNRYEVLAENRRYSCRLKGSFKNEEIKTTNPIAVGDEVLFDEPKEGEEWAWITTILPRKNYIIRRSANLSKQAHILGSNLDRTLLIATVNYPVTSTTFIDRFLATGVAYNVETAIVFNKIDRYNLSEEKVLDGWIQLYNNIGYRCFKLSTLTGEGLSEIKDYLANGISLVAGHSGVGKSTFINTLIPTASLRTASISDIHNSGVHTTTYSEMLQLPNSRDAFLIDTPGIRGFGTIDFEKEKVGHYFPEIFEVSKECRFHNCTHTHEPGCSVLISVKKGVIAASRYKSYISILEEDEKEKYRAGY